MPAAERARLAADEAPLALAWAAVPDGGTGAAVTADVPLPLDRGAARCVLMIEDTDSTRAAPRRPLAHEIVRSTYRGAAAQRANPEYRRLRAEQADELGGGVGIFATGDAETDLIGALAGTVLAGIRRVVNGRAQAELAATPSTLSEPAWEPYTFEVTTLEATRGGDLRVRLVDRVAGMAWPLEREVVQRRVFRVAGGRRARDRGLLEGTGGDLAAGEDVAVWEQGGLRPSLAALLGELGGIEGAPTRMADLPPPAAAAVAARSETVAGVTFEQGADGVRRYRLAAPAATGTVTPEP